MSFKKDNYKLLFISMISFITTFSMFNKLKNDYGMLIINEQIQNKFKGLIPYNDNIQLKVIDYFNMFKDEYMIGLIILAFLVFISLDMTYEIYKKAKVRRYEE